MERRHAVRTGVRLLFAVAATGSGFLLFGPSLIAEAGVSGPGCSAHITNQDGVPVDVAGVGTCTAAALVDVQGNPLGTPIGDTALALSIGAAAAVAIPTAAAAARDPGVPGPDQPDLRTRYGEGEAAMWAGATPAERQSIDLANGAPPPAPVDEIVGTYTVDNTSVQAIGGCGDSGAQAKDAPFTLTVVKATRPAINVRPAGGGTPVTLSGPNFDNNGDHVDYTQDLGQGITASLNRNFYVSSGRWQFNGEYATSFSGGGCGYRFVAVRS